MTNEEFEAIGAWDCRPKKGDPKIDIRALCDYCHKNGIPTAGHKIPEEVAKMFIVGYYE